MGVRTSFVVGCLAVLSLGVAHAASVGGVTAASLAAFSQPAVVPHPTILGCDNFTGTNGATLDGRAATVASRCANLTWTQHLGAWSIQSNRAASSGVAGALVTLSTASANTSVLVVLTSLNTGGRSAGVVLSHDGVDSYLAAVLVDGSPDRVELRVVDAAGSVIAATAPVTLTSTNTLAATRVAGAVSVRLNGTVVLSTSLTSAQQTSLGTGSRAGLLGPNATVRFDDLVVTTP